VRSSFGLALALAALFAFTGIGHELTAPDEIRVAEVGREMAVSGDVVVPRLGGEPFLEHPPLFYAAVGHCVVLLGPNLGDAAARLPAACATVVLLLLAFDLGRRLHDARAGLLAMLVLATTIGFFRYSHRALVDIGLACGVGVSFWAWARLLLARRTAPDARPSPALVLALYAGAAAAFLVKGPVGPLLVAAPVLADLVRHRRRGQLRSWSHLPGLLMLLAGCLVWPLALWRRAGGQAFSDFAVSNVVERVVPSAAYAGGHVNPPWFYLLAFPAMTAPWVVVLPAVWLALRGEERGGAERFLGWIFPLGLVALSLPATKRPLYLLPLLMPLAVVVGCWLARLPLRERLSSLERAPLRLLAAPFALLPALVRKDPFDWRGLRRTGPRVAVALFALAVTVGAASDLVDPGVFADPDRDTHTLPADLVGLGVLQGPLAGYRLDERTRATVPFRTGLILSNLKRPEELRGFLDEHPEGRVLIRDETCSTLPVADRTRLAPLRHWDFGRQRYDLYAARESPERDP